MLYPSTNYLESLTKPNVKPVFGNIKEYNTVWRHYARRQRVCILCLGLGTGFQTSFRPAFPLTGRNDTNLAEVWGEEPRSYSANRGSGFRNYFMLLGPNSPLPIHPLSFALRRRNTISPSFSTGGRKKTSARSSPS